MLTRTDTLYLREMLRAAKKALQEAGKDTATIVEHPFASGRPGNPAYAEAKVVGNRAALAALVRVLGEIEA